MSRYAPTFQLLLLRNPHCFQDNANNPLATSTVGKHFSLFHQGCSCSGWRNCTPSLSQMSEIVEHRSCANLVSKMFSYSSCSLEVILQLGCPLAPNTTTGLSSVHVGQWVEPTPTCTLRSCWRKRCSGCGSFFWVEPGCGTRRPLRHRWSSSMEQLRLSPPLRRPSLTARLQVD